MIENIKRKDIYYILIDNPIDILVHKFMFKKELQSDVNIIHFKNAEQGLKHLEELQSVATIYKIIILMEMEMQGMGGHEFLEHFGKLQNKIRDKVKIFMASSYLNKIEINNITDNPHVCGFLPKPLSVKDISAIIYANN